MIAVSLERRTNITGRECGGFRRHNSGSNHWQSSLLACTYLELQSHFFPFSDTFSGLLFPELSFIKNNKCSSTEQGQLKTQIKWMDIRRGGLSWNRVEERD